jgi:lipoate-protein ligase A
MFSPNGNQSTWITAANYKRRKASTEREMTWELIIDNPLDGLSNMAIDSALLEEVETSDVPRTIVRFYQWRRPTVSLGRNQQVCSAVDEDYCFTNRIDVVHRPTGGRAVLHDDELTYAVASNDASFFGDTIYGNYKRVSEALCSGFHQVGVQAILACDTRKPNIADFEKDPPCFISTSRYELMVNGRKIVGSAQRRMRRGFLQHGSMPIVCDPERLARITRIADPSSLRQEMAGITEFVAKRPTIQALTDAMVSGFEQYFGIQFEIRPPRQ